MLIALTSISVTSFGQKRPVRKTTAPVSKTEVTETPTEVEPAPVKKAVVEVSPAQGFFNQGLKCEAKDYDCQISNYTKAVNLNLNTKKVFKNRGNAYLQRKDFDKAIADFTKLIELDLNDASGYKNRGRIYLENSNSPQAVNTAIRDFTSAIDLEPKDVESYILRAKAYLSIGETAKGHADFNNAVRIDPKNTEVLTYQARIFYNTENFDKAIEAYSKIISLQPVNTEAFIGRARSLEMQKKYDLAVQDYSKAIELNSKDSEPHVNLAGIFEGENKLDQAIKEYSKAIELAPSNSTVLFKRAKLFHTSNKHAEALVDITKVIELSPRNARAYEFRCGLEKEGNNLTRAVEDCSIAIALDPNVDDAYIYRLDIFGEFSLAKILGKYPQLAPAYAQMNSDYIGFRNKRINIGVEIRTSLPRAQLFLSLAIAEKRFYRQGLAEEHFSKALELDPTLVEAFVGRAQNRGFSATDDALVRSLQDFKQAAAIDPHNENLLDSNIYLYIISHHVENLDFNKLALELVNTLVDSNPKDLRPLVDRLLLRDKFLTIEGDRPFIKNGNGGGANKLTKKLRDEDWNGTKSAIVSDLKRVVELCGSSEKGKVSLSLDAAGTLRDYGPLATDLLNECYKRLDQNNQSQSEVADILSLYNVSQAGTARAERLPAPSPDDIVVQEEDMRLVREQETQRVAREDADFQKQMSEQAAIAQQQALRYEQEVAAIRQKIKEKKAQQNAAALNAIGNLVNTIVAQSQAKSSQPQPPNTPSRPQTTQSGGTSNANNNQNSGNDCPPYTGSTQSTNTGAAEPGTQKEYGWSEWQNHPSYRGLSMRNRVMFQQKGQSYWYFEMEIKNNYQEKVYVTAFTSDKCKMRNNEINELYSDGSVVTISAGGTGRETYLRSASSSHVKYWVTMYRESGNGKIAKHDDGSLPLKCQIYPNDQFCPGQP